MTALRSSTIVPLVAGLVLVSGVPATAQAVWTVVPSPSPRLAHATLHGVAGSSPNLLWAVGDARSGDGTQFTRRSVILRFDGARWTTVDHPSFSTSHTLFDVDAPHPEDAWAVGTMSAGAAASRTLVEHFDGVRWRVEASPSPDPDGFNHLRGVRSIPGESGAAWAVGSRTRPTSSAGYLNLILRRTAGRWQVVPSPSPYTLNHLAAVDATGPDNAWAVGQGFVHPIAGPSRAVVQRWDGTRWSELPVPQVTAAAAAGIPTTFSGVEALAPDDVWVAGGIADQPRMRPFLLHYDGVSWTEAAVPPLEVATDLSDVVGTSRTDLHAVGARVALHWNGTSWTREPLPVDGAHQQLNSIAAVAPGSAWIVGARYELTSQMQRTLTLVRRPRT